jgi:hypothetical protein
MATAYRVVEQLIAPFDIQVKRLKKKGIILSRVVPSQWKSGR